MWKNEEGRIENDFPSLETLREQHFYQPSFPQLMELIFKLHIEEKNSIQFEIKIFS